VYTRWLKRGDPVIHARSEIMRLINATIVNTYGNGATSLRARLDSHRVSLASSYANPVIQTR
jgi:hypothetical protein